MAAITSQTFHPAPTLGVPRGARIAATAFLALLSGLSRHLAHQVTAPRQRTRMDDAAEVREMARHWEHSDPGFAADLYAAAARHESLDD
ncbi:MAG: hypothetical protein J0M20_15990 [Burkholderiales bacterium]|nr:hypothetical protein [Burkholderiales bacterium]